MSALDGARRKPTHEILLEREEDDERKGHRDERRCREHLPVLPPTAEQIPKGDREHLVLRRSPEEHQRHQQIVPDPKELEDRERGESGDREWDDEPPENREVIRAVDLGRLNDRRRE